MKAKKRGRCSCVTLSRWRSWDFCSCSSAKGKEDDSFYFTGYTFKMPWTNKTWTISRGSWYVSFADGATKFHIVENGSAISAAMVTNKDVIIEDNADYIKLAMLYETIQDNIAQDWAEAKTTVSDDEKDIIVAGFNTLKNQQVWFDWDGTTFWNNNNSFPLYNVVDYNGEVLWQQWLLETGGKFAYLEGNDWDTFMDYYSDLLQAGATKMKVDYEFSGVIREWFALESRPSKGGIDVDGYTCYVPTTTWYLYKLSFTNDNVLQLIMAEAGQWIPGVDAWTVVTLSNEAEDYIAHNWEWWIYLDAIGDEKVLWELAA